MSGSPSGSVAGRVTVTGWSSGVVADVGEAVGACGVAVTLTDTVAAFDCAPAGSLTR